MSGLSMALGSGVVQGLLWGVMALGLYITFRLLKISDLTVDGSFTTGGAVAAVCIMGGWNPFLAIIAATVAGMVAGAITGILHTQMKIPALLSGILTQIALYTINLRIMGKPNIPLLQVGTIFSAARDSALSRNLYSFLISLPILLVVIALMYWFFGTEIGTAVRATGDNPKMVRALGINTSLTTVLGLILGNGLVAMSGALVAQQQGFADIGMGTGAIVIGLAAIIIGETLFFQNHFMLRLIGVLIGSVLYRLAITIVLRWDPIESYDLKLFTAIIVALALWLPQLSSNIKVRRLRRIHARQLSEGGDSNAQD